MNNKKSIVEMFGDLPNDEQRWKWVIENKYPVVFTEDDIFIALEPEYNGGTGATLVFDDEIPMNNSIMQILNAIGVPTYIAKNSDEIKNKSYLKLV